MLLLLSFVLPGALAVEPSQVAAMADASVSDRLGQLIAAVNLSDAQLDTLAATDPAVVYQLRDTKSVAALRFILAMSPSDIRAVREGGSVVRSASGWSDAEATALGALCAAVGVKASQVDAVHLRTHQAALLRVELVGKKPASIDLAWPLSWNASAVAATIGTAPSGAAASAGAGKGAAARASLTSSAAVSGGVPIVDPGFETPNVPAWEVATDGDGRVLWDEARHAAGKRSLRLEAGERGTVTVRQRVVPPGETVVPTSLLTAPDGLEGRFSFGFAWGERGDEAALVAADPTLGGWSTLRLVANLPESPPELWLVLRLEGPGAVNVDDLRVDLGSSASVAEWQRFDRGVLRVWADPMRVPTAATTAATVDRAVQNAIARLGLTVSGSARLFLYQSASDLATLGSPRSNPAAGYCWQTPTDPWPGACALSVFLHRTWGTPKNALIAEALPRALAGSTRDLDALALAALPGLPADWTSRYPEVGADAAPSFAAWLLEHWGAPALRAAWLGPVEAIAAGGQDLPALLAAWRKEIGG